MIALFIMLQFLGGCTSEDAGADTDWCTFENLSELSCYSDGSCATIDEFRLNYPDCFSEEPVGYRFTGLCQCRAGCGVLQCQLLYKYDFYNWYFLESSGELVRFLYEWDVVGPCEAYGMTADPTSGCNELGEWAPKSLGFEPDIDSDTDADTDVDSDADVDSDVDADVDSDSETDTFRDSGTRSDTGIDTAVETGRKHGDTGQHTGLCDTSDTGDCRG